MTTNSYPAHDKRSYRVTVNWDGGSKTVTVAARDARQAQTLAMMVRDADGFAVKVPSGAMVTYSVEEI